MQAIIFTNRKNASIWDKPYYIKLFVKNIGSHKKNSLITIGKKRLREYDDQYTFSFLMPLIVRGSWDVMPPDEVIPSWSPPQPRTVRGFQLSHLLPSWGLSFFGKTTSLILLIGAVLFILNFFFPGLKEIIVFISNEIFASIKGLLLGIKKLFSPKEKSSETT